MSSRLFDALDHRFTDMDEVKDIAEQGCANCAPSGFIYYYENRKFFLEHEDEIEDYLDTKCNDIITKSNLESFNIPLTKEFKKKNVNIQNIRKLT